MLTGTVHLYKSVTNWQDDEIIVWLLESRNIVKLEEVFLRSA